VHGKEKKGQAAKEQEALKAEEIEAKKAKFREFLNVMGANKHKK
jgi:hypothetical protein